MNGMSTLLKLMSTGWIDIVFSINATGKTMAIARSAMKLSTIQLLLLLCFGVLERFDHTKSLLGGAMLA